MHNRGELLAQAERAYPRFLVTLITGSPFFPFELHIGKSKRAETYTARQAELAEFRSATTTLGLEVEWREVNDPRFGRHDRPERAVFPDEEPFLRALGKIDEVRRFRADISLINAVLPDPSLWLQANVSRVIENHGRWPELLRVVQWFRKNPRPDIYLRQLPVEGVDTKFFEKNSRTLDSLLLHAQPNLVDTTCSRFEARHGLRWEEPLIRLRFLDPDLQKAHGFPIADLAVPAPVFRNLPIAAANTIITENLRNYLSLPLFSEAVAVYGSGDAAQLLAGTPWLEQSRLIYWGDIDQRGFAILSRLRTLYPKAESVLMDAATLHAYRALAVSVAKAPVEISCNLNPSEQTAFEEVSNFGLRLEQERIPFRSAVDTLCNALSRV